MSLSDLHKLHSSIIAYGNDFITSIIDASLTGPSLNLLDYSHFYRILWVAVHRALQDMNILDYPHAPDISFLQSCSSILLRIGQSPSAVESTSDHHLPSQTDVLMTDVSQGYLQRDKSESHSPEYHTLSVIDQMYRISYSIHDLLIPATNYLHPSTNLEYLPRILAYNHSISKHKNGVFKLTINPILQAGVSYSFKRFNSLVHVDWKRGRGQRQQHLVDGNSSSLLQSGSDVSRCFKPDLPAPLTLLPNKRVVAQRISRLDVNNILSNIPSCIDGDIDQLVSRTKSFSTKISKMQMKNKRNSSIRRTLLPSLRTPYFKRS